MKYLLICAFVLIPTLASAQTPAATATPTYDELKARMERFEARLTDWPNLKRYADSNSKLAAPAKDENRVVFMGDSITDSWKITEYFPGKPYVNRGISGQTTPQMVVRFQPDVIALRPKVVVILAGTNDIAGNTGAMSLEAIQNNYRSMAELARANGIKVVFASILPISDYNKNAQGQTIVRSIARQPEKILALNKWLKDYAAANKHIYLDYFSATADDKGFLRADLANDGLHPHAEGYKLMAPLAQKAIDFALR
jgi:lysophospholipase L1-like esterase